MAALYFHASHEQFSPSDLLSYVQLAEAEGFHGCHASDHFHPWSENQGQSGYVFSWLGAAMEATRFPFSVITAPGQRYHPAIVAQAIGTLLQMYPDRLDVSLGSGEALNECITGEPWPDKPIRNKRLRESALAISRLLAGEEVLTTGLVRIHRAKLYTRPSAPTPLMCAALSQDTAAWAGTWADGLLTCYKANGELKNIIDVFRQSGGNNKPVHVKLTFSYAQDDSFARLDAYHQWRFQCIEDTRLAELSSVKEFDSIANDVSLDQLLRSLPISNQTDYFIPLIEETFAAGADRIILHNVNRNQTDFIRDFGSRVIKIFS